MSRASSSTTAAAEADTSDMTLDLALEAERTCACHDPTACGSNGPSTSWSMFCGHLVDQFCVERAIMAAPMMFSASSRSQEPNDELWRLPCGCTVTWELFLRSMRAYPVPAPEKLKMSPTAKRVAKKKVQVKKEKNEEDGVAGYAEMVEKMNTRRNVKVKKEASVEVEIVVKKKPLRNRAVSVKKEVKTDSDQEDAGYVSEWMDE